MKAVCEQEGANYITRQSNIGYKAGNLRNGLEHTDGDFLIICDADTRVFPTLLSHTLGYFRDPTSPGCRPHNGFSISRKERIWRAGCGVKQAVQAMAWAGWRRKSSVR